MKRVGYLHVSTNVAICIHCMRHPEPDLTNADVGENPEWISVYEGDTAASLPCDGCTESLE